MESGCWRCTELELEEVKDVSEMKDRTKGRVPEPFPSPEPGFGSSCRPCTAVRRYRRGRNRVGVEDEDPGGGERVESSRQLVATRKD